MFRRRDIEKKHEKEVECIKYSIENDKRALKYLSTQREKAKGMSSKVRNEQLRLISHSEEVILADIKTKEGKLEE